MARPIERSTEERWRHNRKLWIDALRSGEFLQTQNRLYRETDDGPGFCCLGVLCEIAGLMRHDDAYDGEQGVAPARAREFVGLSGEAGEYEQAESLSDLNDQGFTFAEIADIIESEPYGLFKD